MNGMQTYVNALHMTYVTPKPSNA